MKSNGDFIACSVLISLREMTLTRSVRQEGFPTLESRHHLNWSQASRCARGPHVEREEYTGSCCGPSLVQNGMTSQPKK